MTTSNVEIKTRKLYVGNFPWETSEKDLQDLFADYGDVNSVNIITGAGEGEKGKHLGFGFIEFATEIQAQSAYKKLHRELWRGRRLILGPAYPKGQTQAAR